MARPVASNDKFSSISRLAGNSPHLAHEAGFVRQAVQQVNGLFRGLGLVDTFAEIDRDARHDAGRPVSPLAFNQPVHMAADQPNDLGMTAYYVGKRRGLLGPSVAADVVIIDIERWMVDE